MDLETKDKLEREKDKELEVKAKLELEEWYVKYNERIEAAKAENRNRTQPIEEDAGESLEWEKVNELCGFKSPKNSVKDTSRLKSILIGLKNSKT